MDNEVKQLASIVDTKNINVEDRTITFIGSSQKQDRSGDIIDAAGWDIKNFMSNPVFLWSHDGRSIPPIGRAVEVTQGADSLKFKIEFAPAEVHPFADSIFKLYAAGFIKGVSVGFLPRKREPIRDPNTQEFIGFKFLEQELIELSAVSVPDNPEALIQEAVDGVLQKEAAEFLSKSLYAEKSLSATVQELKKEILLMSESKVVDGTPVDKGEGEANTNSPELVVTDKELDNRLKMVENRLEQLETFAEMHKSATEVFQVVKTLLDNLQSGSNGKDVINPFLAVLAPGNAPEGTPQDSKALVDAISKATKSISTWTPKSDK